MIYISIGCQCSPRMYIKENLKLEKSTGYKSCPFDLCITPYKSLYDCLKDDFARFFELELIPGGIADGDRSQCANPLEGYNIRNSYGMIFNHEGSTHSHLFCEGTNDDDYFIRDDFAKFKERYQKRIDNFYSYIQEHSEICFIHSLHEGIEGQGDLQKICDLLSSKYTGKIFTPMKI